MKLIRIAWGVFWLIVGVGAACGSAGLISLPPVPYWLLATAALGTAMWQFKSEPIDTILWLPFSKKRAGE